MLTRSPIVQMFFAISLFIGIIAMYIPLILGAVDFIALGFTGHSVTNINWNTPWGVFLIVGPLFWSVGPLFWSVGVALKYGR